METVLPRRERNKVRTWEGIHECASSMVLRHGFSVTTIDAIADRAGVSRRTFFNYFASKEDAVLGTQPARLTAADLELFRSSSDDLFGRVVRLMTAAVRSVFHDLPTFSKQRQLLKANPQLRERIDLHVREAGDLVQEQLSGVGSDEDARALVLLAGTVMRFAFTPDPDGAIDATPEKIDAAIERFRHVMKEAV